MGAGSPCLANSTACRIVKANLRILEIDEIKTIAYVPDQILVWGPLLEDLYEENRNQNISKKPDQTTGSFDALELDPRVREGVLDMRYETMTPVQAEVIPLAIAGNDVIAASQTGTGKTAAFLIPLPPPAVMDSCEFGTCRQARSRTSSRTPLARSPP